MVSIAIVSGLGALIVLAVHPLHPRASVRNPLCDCSHDSGQRLASPTLQAQAKLWQPACEYRAELTLSVVAPAALLSGHGSQPMCLQV